MKILRLLWSFLTRDFYEATSYRIAFLLDLGNIFFRAFTFYFVSRLFGDAVSPMLAGYGGDYFSFVIIGLAFGGYFSIGLGGFAGALRRAQTTGTLEAMIMTPAPLSLIILGSAAWSYAFTTLRVAIYLLLGAGFLGLSMAGANVGGALLTLLLSIVAFASFGIIAASVIMVIKRGDPITGLFSSVSFLLGGVYYPLEVMPEWLQAISKLLPITYGINAMRLALLNGAPLSAMRTDLLVLVGFCVAVFPLSLLIFRFAVERARQDGSLTHY
jgi:ABC-2 type transport system permease protein